jgi:hypothetical protein
MVTRTFTFFVGIEPILKQSRAALPKLTLFALHNKLRCVAQAGVLRVNSPEGMFE